MRLKAKLDRYERLADWLCDASLITDAEWFEQERLALAARLIELALGVYKDAKAVLDVKPGRGEHYPVRVTPKANGRCSLSIRDKHDYLLFVAQVISKGTTRDDYIEGQEAIAWLIKGLRLIASGAAVELSLNVKPKPKEQRSRVKSNAREDYKDWLFGWLHTITTDRNIYTLRHEKIFQIGTASTLPYWKAEVKLARVDRTYTSKTIEAFWKRDRARRVAIHSNDGWFRIHSNRV